MILEVPYQTQVANGIWNDCGESCCVMVGKYYGKEFTISEMEDKMNRHGQTDTLVQLKDGIAQFGIEMFVDNQMNLPFLVEALQQGKPSICLINYGKVPPYAKIDQTYTGYHFVVLIGCDDLVHYHDPLGRSDQTVQKSEWDRFFTGQSLIPIQSKEVAMDSEALKALTDAVNKLTSAVTMLDKMYRIQNNIKFVKPNENDPACGVIKTKRYVTVSGEEKDAAGFTWDDLNK